MCDIRYFRMARHHFISAKEALKCFSWDELFINDTLTNFNSVWNLH